MIIISHIAQQSKYQTYSTITELYSNPHIVKHADMLKNIKCEICVIKPLKFQVPALKYTGCCIDGKQVIAIVFSQIFIQC
mgnify:CR=1 FL=1